LATSGSTDFSSSRDTIIKGALRKVGALAQGQTPATNDVNDAAEALNNLAKAWMADGMPLWKIATYDFALTNDVNTYNIGLTKTLNTAKPQKILQAWIRETATALDTPLQIETLYDYNRLSNKTSNGRPIQLTYHPQRVDGNIYIYPTPDATIASGYRIFIRYQAPYEDFDAANNEPDFPQEWFQALIYGLAYTLAPEYGIPIQERNVLREDMLMFKAEALSGGSEEGSMFIQPRTNY
jgi:Asp-tRNA(Asn)/Glu-tRNA(Gln) amidotransferase A subunit family amidase